MMLASGVIGIVNWREYWMRPTSPSDIVPLATWTLLMTAIAT